MKPMTISDETIGGDDCSEQLEIYFATDVISEIVPRDFHQNNRSLFKLARLVRSYERAIGRTATRGELEFVFDRWSSFLTRGFWRSGLTRDDYYAEFLEVYSYARTGLNIELAVGRAKAAPLPEVEGFTDERIRLLVAICREMQEITGAEPFFLPTRTLGEILGVHYSHVARWLRALEVLQIIHLAPGEVRRRGGNRCPRYYYGQHLPDTGAVGITTTTTSAEPVLPPNPDHSNEIRDANHDDSDKKSLSLAN